MKRRDRPSAAACQLEASGAQLKLSVWGSARRVPVHRCSSSTAGDDPLLRDRNSLKALSAYRARYSRPILVRRLSHALVPPETVDTGCRSSRVQTHLYPTIRQLGRLCAPPPIDRPAARVPSRRFTASTRRHSRVHRAFRSSSASARAAPARPGCRAAWRSSATASADPRSAPGSISDDRRGLPLVPYPGARGGVARFAGACSTQAGQSPAPDDGPQPCRAVSGRGPGRAATSTSPVTPDCSRLVRVGAFGEPSWRTAGRAAASCPYFGSRHRRPRRLEGRATAPTFARPGAVFAAGSAG